jgi:hypothetical protein
MRAEPGKPDEMAHIMRWNLTFSLAAAAAALALVSPLFALSLAIGAAIEAINFRGLHASAVALFGGELPGGRRWAAGFGLRFALLGAVVGVALYAGAHPVGLVIGLSLIMPAAVIEAWRHRPPPDESAPALAPDDEEWERWNPWLASESAPADEDDA